MFQVAQFFRHISLGRPAEAIALKPQLAPCHRQMSSSFLAPSAENNGWVGLMLDDFFAGKHIAKLVGGLEHVYFYHHIIPTDELIFFRGVETTNQKINGKRSFIIWPHLSTNLTFKRQCHGGCHWGWSDDVHPDI